MTEREELKSAPLPYSKKLKLRPKQRGNKAPGIHNTLAAGVSYIVTNTKKKSDTDEF